MKIDFYISSLSSGGAEHVMANLARYFAAGDNEVNLISYEKRPQFYNIDKNVNVIKYNNKAKNRFFLSLFVEVFRDIRDTVRRLKKGKPQVAVSFLSRCNIMLIIAGIFSKSRIVVCDRNYLLKEYPGYIFTISCFFYRFADAVIVQTHEVKKTYPKYLQNKIFVLENPLDFKELELQCIKEDTKNSDENYIKRENTVLSVGRLEKQKDFKTLINAFKKTAAKFPDWQLKIFGQGCMKKELEDYIKNIGMCDRIKLCGVTHTPFFEMKKAGIFVLSSFYEGFPNVLCEAMYAKTPCVSTRCKCGPSDIIKDAVNGYLVDVGDEVKMAEKMEFLMGNGEERKTMGERAFESVKYLDINRVFLRWDKVLHKIVDL